MTPNPELTQTLSLTLALSSAESALTADSLATARGYFVMARFYWQISNR